MASIGEQIIAARRAKGMTQDALAKALNISRSTISNYETDRRLPDAKTLLKLSKALDYSFEGEAEEDVMAGEASFGIEGDEAAVSCEAEEDEAATSPEIEGDEAPAEGETSPEIEADEVPAERPFENGVETTSPENGDKAAPSEIGAKPAPARSRRIVVWALAAAMVCLCVGIAVARGRASRPAVYTAPDGTRVTVGQFQQETPREDGRAWLSVEQVLKVQRGEGLEMWMYDFVCHEMNGVGMTVDRLAVYTFVGDAVHIQMLSGDELESGGLGRTIAPYGEWFVSGGLPVQEKVTGIGMELIGTDEGGESLTFTDYLKLNS